MNRNIAGVILAGGQSRRFGQPKAFSKKGGVPFYQYSIQTLQPLVEKLILVTNHTIIQIFSAEPSSLSIITDLQKYEGQGPLAGIYSAMEFYEADWYMVLPIDVPFINHIIFHGLMKFVQPGKEAIIPVVCGQIQPLIAIYHCSVKIKMMQQLDHGQLSIRK